MLALSLQGAGTGGQAGQWGLQHRKGKTPPKSFSAWLEHAQLEGPGQLLGAGHLSLHRAGLFAVMGDPRHGTSLEQLCWHIGKEGMDGGSGQNLVTQELGLDNQVGAGVPPGKVQNATCPADTGVWLLVSPHKPARNVSPLWQPGVVPFPSSTLLPLISARAALLLSSCFYASR